MRRLCSSSSSPSSVVYSSPAISSRPLVRRTRSQHCFPAKNTACASVINDTLGTSLVLEEEKKKKRGKERTSRRRKALLSIVLPLPLLSGADILGLDCAARAEENKQTSAFFGAGDGQQLVSYFRELSYRGVKAATVGIADGREVVRVKFDESRLPFSDLLRVYFRRVDASDGGGQFKERGERYAPVIFAPDEAAYLEASRVLRILGESQIFGNEDPSLALPVKIIQGQPSTFEVLDGKNAALTKDDLKKLLKKSGRYRFLDDEKTGLWGLSSSRAFSFFFTISSCSCSCSPPSRHCNLITPEAFFSFF
mmetsp:Transcript_6482/g.11840  ORF Transcript_6482/g.11840 Transcript_6482/m.11840 type:complete len:309 (+) Transcript_6482:38-964(+)